MYKINYFVTAYPSPFWRLLTDSTEISIALNTAKLEVNSIIKEAVDPISISELSNRLPDDAHIWIGILSAEHFIATNLQNNIAIDIAAEQWQEISTSLIKMQINSRKRITLFNLFDALRTDIQFCDLLPAHLSEKISCKFYEQVDDLSLLIANQFIFQNSSVRRLNSELLASCIYIESPANTTIDLNALYKSARANKARDKIAQLEYALNESLSDSNLLFQQLQKTQETLDSYFLAARENTDKRNFSSISHRDLQRAKARAVIAEFEHKQLSAEIDRIRASISWKAAKPIRALGRLARRQIAEVTKDIDDIRLLLASEFFDADWYLSTYPDVLAANFNPAEHYLLYGASEGRQPSPYFDGAWYLETYPDVAEAKLNPLLHYIRHGHEEGRLCHPQIFNQPYQG